MTTPANQLSPILSAVLNIMTEAGNKGMHIRDIALRAVQTNQNMQMSADEFQQKAGQALNSNAKSKSPSFYKVIDPKTKKEKRGYYKAKRTITQPAIKIQQVASPAVTTNYSGRAGEYAVASELLFWGKNVLFNAIDEGIDLVAQGAKNIHFIQVKTSSMKEDKASFVINIDAWEATAKHEPWYVFVMRDGATNTYAVIPFTQLNLWKNGGYIRGTKSMSIQIQRNAKKTEYKLCGMELNMFINRFDQLK